MNKPVFSRYVPGLPRTPGFFKSNSNGSWWYVYPIDKPNRFIGHEDNLPAYVKAALRAEIGA